MNAYSANRVVLPRRQPSLDDTANSKPHSRHDSRLLLALLEVGVGEEEEDFGEL
jgi:hypothetical protein